MQRRAVCAAAYLRHFVSVVPPSLTCLPFARSLRPALPCPRCSIATLSASQIFEELPLRIRNPHLIQAALFDVTARGALTTKALGAGGAGALSASAAAAAAAAAAAPASGAASSAAGTGAPVPSAVVAAGASAAAPAGTAAAGTGAESDFTRLDLNSGPFLEKHLELLKDVTEQLLRAQSETAAYQRRLESHVRQREQWLARRVRSRCGLLGRKC
jgi:hypothetical protein